MDLRKLNYVEESQRSSRNPMLANTGKRKRCSKNPMLAHVRDIRICSKIPGLLIWKRNRGVWEIKCLLMTERQICSGNHILAIRERGIEVYWESHACLCAREVESHAY